MLRVEGLSKRYGAITAVNNVSFHVSKGEIHGLVGPNGSGKTTTFKSIIGLVRPDQGRIFLDNYNLLNDNDRKRVKMGFVPESLSIPGWMKVSDFLYSMSLMYGLDKREAKNRVEEVTNILGLENLLDKN